MQTNSSTISVIVPAYNVESTINETLTSIIRQTHRELEIIIVDDGSTDRTADIIAEFHDPRIVVIKQKNRGLAGARNSGIYHSTCGYVAFCDSDDVWLPEKLELHYSHLQQNPDVGISYSGSQLINEQSLPLRISQNPKLHAVTPADVFKRNPIGNGSSAVFRREALDAIAFRPMHETERDWWFDETFRQSEDIDAWMRFALASDFKIEGIEGNLTLYRIQAGGLSTNLKRQYETWCRVRDRVLDTAPAFGKKYAPAATAYQLRYLARRAATMHDGKTAAQYCRQSLATSLVPMLEEPVKTLTTLIACEAMNLFGDSFCRYFDFKLKTANRIPR